MEIKRVTDAFNRYKVECSFGELMAIKAAVAEFPGAVADELTRNIAFYEDSGELVPPGTPVEDSKGGKGKEEVEKVEPTAATGAKAGAMDFDAEAAADAALDDPDAGQPLELTPPEPEADEELDEPEAPGSPEPEGEDEEDEADSASRRRRISS